MTAPFLFRRRESAELSRGQRIAYRVWTPLWLFLFSCGAGVLSLLLAIGNKPYDLFWSYFQHPLIALLNILPVVLAVFFFYGLTGRPGFSFLLTSIVTLCLSLANFYKLAFRSDPMLASDLVYLKEAVQMTRNYPLFLNKRIVLFLLFELAGWAMFRFFAQARLPRARGRVLLAVSMLALGFLGRWAYTSSKVYNTWTDNPDYGSKWSSAQVFISKGFLYPYLHSIPDAIPQKPEGYSAKESAEQLAQYPDADIPSDRQISVVGVMLEAYADFSDFGGLDIASDVYGPYHQLEAEGYSGKLVTNIFAGGTVNTERAFLTGLTHLDNFRGATNSYAWYFRSQGYQVTGDHPSFQWFYNRQNINQYLGFQSYRFVENYYTAYTGGTVAPDNVFFPQLLQSVEDQLKNGPLFSFSVSYQGHGPYTDEGLVWPSGSEVLTRTDALTDGEYNILANYLGSVKDTSQRLYDFAESLNDLDEPVVLVVFGDHKPWLGDDNSVYNAMGYSLDDSTEEGFLNHYSTQYLIWANTAAKKIIGDDFVGQKGNAVSPAFLMNKVFSLCSWTGPSYLQAVAPVADALPVVNTSGRFLTGDGSFESSASLSEEDTALLSRYKCLEYYWKHHFAYAEYK